MYIIEVMVYQIYTTITPRKPLFRPRNSRRISRGYPLDIGNKAEYRFFQPESFHNNWLVELCDLKSNFFSWLCPPRPPPFVRPPCVCSFKHNSYRGYPPSNYNYNCFLLYIYLFAFVIFLYKSNIFQKCRMMIELIYSHMCPHTHKWCHILQTTTTTTTEANWIVRMVMVRRRGRLSLLRC